MIKMNSESSNKTCHTILTTNIYKKIPIYHDIQNITRQTMTISKIQNLIPFIKNYKGMKIIITKTYIPKLLMGQLVMLNVFHSQNHIGFKMIS
jgi:hypothetical protein